MSQSWKCVLFATGMHKYHTTYCCIKETPQLVSVLAPMFTVCSSTRNKNRTYPEHSRQTEQKVNIALIDHLFISSHSNGELH